MAEIFLIAIPANKVGDRQVFNTGMSTVGRADNDYLCGHCSHTMMRDFDVNRLEVEIVYQCGICGGHNIKPEQDDVAAGEPELTN
ncbi:MAG: hypothetical protein K2X44_05920 [Magnetospirillum sp.]|nr:hypothetical protein [Magnetospirillum sp.]